MGYFIKNYSIANDTLNKRINIPELENTIIKSDILASFYQVETNQDNLIISFKTALSTEDVNKLNTIIATHPGTPPIEETTTVKIMEEPSYCKMDRTLKTKSIEIATGETSVKTSFPYDIVLLGGEFHCKDENVGDRCQFVINPDKIVGVTDAIVSNGVTFFDIPTNVLPYMFKGFNLTLTDGTNTDELGEIITINGNTVTVENATTREWAIGAQIKSEYYMVPHIRFDAPGTFEIGKNSNSGNFLPAGTELEFRYFDENGLTKNVVICFSLEYYL